MTDRKNYAQQLDRAAARAEMIDASPATSKQCWYIAGLMEQAGTMPAEWGYGPCDSSAILTSRRASALIDQIKCAMEMRAAV